MSKARKIIALLLTMVILSTAAVLTVNATAGEEEAAGADGASKITVHYKSESGTTPAGKYRNGISRQADGKRYGAGRGLVQLYI